MKNYEATLNISEINLIAYRNRKIEIQRYWMNKMFIIIKNQKRSFVYQKKEKEKKNNKTAR